MLDAEELDAVVILAPNIHHHPYTMAALERGLHVLCEKPLGMSSAQAREMTETAERLGLKGEAGVLITEVEDGSPAERAGIQAGSVVLEVNQKPVKSVAEFQDAIASAQKAGALLLLVKEKAGTRFVALKF